ncbi:MAG: hypothetical protein NVS4B3_00630 [Gemmatimonadaceae bacterium]
MISLPLSPQLFFALFALMVLAGPYASARFSGDRAPPEIFRLVTPPAVLGAAIAARLVLSWLGWAPAFVVWVLYALMIAATVRTAMVVGPVSVRVVKQPGND